MKNKEKYEKELLDAIKKGCLSNGGFIVTKVLSDMGLSCKNITCYLCSTAVSMWLEKEYQPPDTDWSKVAVDTPILVRNSEGQEWKKRHFAKYEDETVFVFSGGATSWTEYDICDWKFAKLPDEHDLDLLEGAE